MSAADRRALRRHHADDVVRLAVDDDRRGQARRDRRRTAAASIRSRAPRRDDCRADLHRSGSSARSPAARPARGRTRTRPPRRAICSGLRAVGAVVVALVERAQLGKRRGVLLPVEVVGDRTDEPGDVPLAIRLPQRRRGDRARERIGRSITASTMVNIAVLAPMPSASVRTTTMREAGLAAGGAQREAEVLPGAVERSPLPHLAQRFLDARLAAELLHRVVSGRRLASGRLRGWPVRAWRGGRPSRRPGRDRADAGGAWP